MSIGVVSGPVTLEQFLELERDAPDDVRLELIRGEIREYPGVTTRYSDHSEVTALVSHVILSWLERNPQIWGTVGDGEARCRLFADPESVVGLDVAFWEGEQHVNRPRGQSFFDGPPVLAVEVLSPSNTQEFVVERVRLFLEAGVKVVWIIDPEFRTVTIHRPGKRPEFVNDGGSLPSLAELPGFSCEASRLFPRRRGAT